MSTQQQQQPQMATTQQQQFTAHSSHGSVGPVIGVLAVITVLGAIAIMIGRICSGRRIMGRGYDFESWVEAKCGSCIDGRVDPPPTRVVLDHRVSSASSGEVGPSKAPALVEEAAMEKKEESGS